MIGVQAHFCATAKAYFRVDLESDALHVRHMIARRLQLTVNCIQCTVRSATETKQQTVQYV